MENKKLGILLVIFGIIVGTFFYLVINQLEQQSIELQCRQSEDCLRIEKGLSYTHLGIGIVVAIFTLGVYLLLFNTSHETVLKQLEQEKRKQIKEEQFNVILSLFEPAEQRVLKIIKEHEGISQNTLAIKADMSKAKVSQILSSFEKKNMITRKEEGKTYTIFLKKFF